MKKLILVFAIGFGLSGCKEAKEFERDLDRVKEMKSQLAVQGPYSYEHKEIMGEYFSGINYLVRKIDEDPKGSKGLESYLKKNDLAGLCRDILVSKSEWKTIVSNCWQGEYFLCSEDILEFEETIERFISLLDGGNRSRFLSNENCGGQWK